MTLDREELLQAGLIAAAGHTPLGKEAATAAAVTALNPYITKDAANGYWLQWTADPLAAAYDVYTPAGHMVTWATTKLFLGNDLAEPVTARVAAAYAQTYYEASYTAAPPPPPARVLPKYGVCPGFASQVWSDTTHAGVMAKMKALAQGRPLLYRVPAGGLSTRLDRDVSGCLNAGLTPYLCIGGTNRTPSNVAPSWLASMALHYKGKNVIYTGPNEPDLNGWDATTVANHSKAIWDTIRSVDSEALIGYAAIWKGSPNAFTSWQPYVKQAVAICRSAFQSGMFFPFHAYDDPALTTTSTQAVWNMWTWYFRKFGFHVGQTAEDIFAAAGLSGVFVNDESGGKNTDPEYTNKCMRILTQAKQNVCHTSTIYAVLPDVAGYNYLLNSDLSERPCYGAFKTFMSGVPL